MQELEPVEVAMHERRRAGYVKGTSQPDGRRIALLVEGGAMRGVISAAMLCALDDLGYRTTFDIVIGCSAGAMNAAYLLGGETWYPLTIYWDNLASKRFLSFHRSIFGRRSIMDLDYGIDTITEVEGPLDCDAVLDSRSELQIFVSNLDTLSAEGLHEFRNREQLKQTLRATCWLPLLNTGPVSLNGSRVVDGGVLMPHLINAIIRETSITHVFSLHTRSPPTGILPSWSRHFAGVT